MSLHDCEGFSLFLHFINNSAHFYQILHTIKNKRPSEITIQKVFIVIVPHLNYCAFTKRGRIKTVVAEINIIRHRKQYFHFTEINSAYYVIS